VSGASAQWRADCPRSAWRNLSARRQSAGKDLAWQPLRPERVCEVKYDHLQGDRFRHATTFLRWHIDKPAAACRYDQLEIVAPYELKKIFGV
jgi:ATP-dependent DNA ligase